MDLSVNENELAGSRVSNRFKLAFWRPSPHANVVSDGDKEVSEYFRVIFVGFFQRENRWVEDFASVVFKVKLEFPRVRLQLIGDII